MFTPMAPKTPKQPKTNDAAFAYVGKLLRERDDKLMEQYLKYLQDHADRLRELGDEEA